MREGHESTAGADDVDALRAKIAELERQLADRDAALAAREATVQRRETELRAAMTDSVTGLRRREWMYQALNRDVERVLSIAGCADLEGVNDVPAALSACDTGQLHASGVSVLMADVAYLGFVNLGGHAAGDTLLRGIGDAARHVGSPSVELPDQELADAPAVFYRHGGDEFTAVLRGTPEHARASAMTFRTSVSATDIPSLTRHGLTPNVDVGLARVDEGIDALHLLIASGSTDIAPGDRVKKIVDLTVRIADRRASIQKGVDRIHVLLRFRREMPEEYMRVISSLRKGAFGVDDATVDAFLAAEDAGQDVDLQIRSYIVQRSDAEFQVSQEHRAEEYAVVKAIADRVTPTT